MKKTDLRMVPIGAAAWAGAAAGILGLHLSVVLVISAVSGALFLKCRKNIFIAFALILLTSFVLSGVRTNAKEEDPLAEAARNGSVIHAIVKISTDPEIATAKRNSESCRSLGTVERILEKGNPAAGSRVFLIASGEQQTSLCSQTVGSIIKVTAKARPAQRTQRQRAFLSGLKGTPVKNPGWLSAITNRMRDGLRESMRWSEPKQGGLVPSLVVGDTSKLDETISSDFKATGLTHLTAVSGTNLTLLLAFALPLARFIGVRGRWIWLVASGSVALFVIVCRAEPSVLRASVMGLIGLAATGVATDKNRGLRALGGAVMALCLIDPWLSLSWGFALSVSASASILVLASGWQIKLRKWLPGPLAEAIAIPLAAQLGTQPLVTCISGEISFVGLFANALSGPFVGMVTVLGLVAGGFSFFSSFLSGCLGWLAGWCVNPIIVIAHTFSVLPGATFQWSATIPSITVLSIFCGMFILVIGKVLNTPWLTILLAFILVVCSLFPLQTIGWLPKDWLYIFCDVGQGSANLVRSGSGSGVLIDAGLDDEKPLRCVEGSGLRRLDAIILTHRHADHVGGLNRILAKFPTENIYSSSNIRGIQTQLLEDGAVLSVGNARISILGGKKLTSDVSKLTGQMENDAGITSKVELFGTKAIFPGDIEIDGQTKLLMQGRDLSGDVLAIPHHGSAHQVPEFFKAVSPKLAVASAGKNNDYGHPSAKSLKLANQSGALVYRTDENGSVAVARSDGKLVAATQR